MAEQDKENQKEQSHKGKLYIHEAILLLLS